METSVPRDIITEDIKQIEKYINDTWKQFITRKECRISEVFPEPENKGLRHIWKYGSADLVFIEKINLPVLLSQVVPIILKKGRVLMTGANGNLQSRMA